MNKVIIIPPENPIIRKAKLKGWDKHISKQNREVIETIDDVISFLEVKKDHHRLMVFHQKGLVCASCGLVGNKILITKWFDGSIHIDLYHISPELKMLMTVDHIIPKARGGKEHLQNKQPMCEKCNFNKGSKMPEDMK